MRELKPVYEESLKELLELLRWFSHFGQMPIIIGGWGVHVYNSYCGSIDVDVIGESFGGKFLEVVERYERTHDYEFYPKDPLGIETMTRKPIVRNGRVFGHIEIDACTVEDPRPSRFHEDETKKLPYSLCLRKKYRREVNFSKGASCYVPSKPLLFLYKLKAVRDRTHDLRTGAGIMAPEKEEFLHSKLLKDMSDLLALLDPSPKVLLLKEEMDLRVLRDLTKRHHLEFALQSVRELPKMRDAISFYNPTLSRKSVEEWVNSSLRSLAA